MLSLVRLLTTWTLLCVGLVLPAVPAYAAQRRALVIGNASYQSLPLTNPANDAKAMADVLLKLGFQVTRAADLNKRGIRDAVNTFGKTVGSDDVVLVFYAGHAVEIDGINYLIPIGFDAITAEDAKDEGYSLETLLGQLAVKSGLKIVIVDACRENFFKRAWDRSNRGGLAPVEPRPEVYLAFSTASGSTASDGGHDPFSPFTAALLSHIETPGLELDIVFRRVRRDVERTTQGRQTPWSNGNLKGEFYFVASQTAPAVEVGAGTSAADGHAVTTDTSKVARSRPATPRRPAPRLRMLTIPEGEFTMGSPSDEAGRYDNVKRSEGPQHHVRVQSFYLAQTEVTQEQWTELYEARRGKLDPLEIGANPSHFNTINGGGPQHPVEQVSWLDAAGFANLLSIEEQFTPCYHFEGCVLAIGEGLVCDSVSFEGADCKGYRLPTEAEWEYAARGGSTTALFTGAAPIYGAYTSPAVGKIAWYGGNSGLAGGWKCGDWPQREDKRLATCGTHPVGSKSNVPHPWGLSDLIGNVGEWTNSHMSMYPLLSATTTDPDGVPWMGIPESIILRGCSWESIPRDCRSASRVGIPPTTRNVSIGFRLARSK